MSKRQIGTHTLDSGATMLVFSDGKSIISKNDGYAVEAAPMKLDEKPWSPAYRQSVIAEVYALRAELDAARHRAEPLVDALLILLSYPLPTDIGESEAEVVEYVRERLEKKHES